MTSAYFQTDCRPDPTASPLLFYASSLPAKPLGTRYSFTLYSHFRTPLYTLDSSRDTLAIKSHLVLQVHFTVLTPSNTLHAVARRMTKPPQAAGLGPVAAALAAARASGSNRSCHASKLIRYLPVPLHTHVARQRSRMRSNDMCHDKNPCVAPRHMCTIHRNPHDSDIMR